MPIFIPLLCLLGMVAARFRGHYEAVPAGQAARADAPERLLRWAAGLLPARRDEWGQAMLGELACIDGRGRRWRFAAGSASAALLMPPWGRAAAVVWTMAAAAVGSAGLYASVGARYRMGAWGWAVAAVVLVILAGYALAASVLLRNPRVALPGLLGGVLMALTWLSPGYTFYDVIARPTPLRAELVPVLVVPLLAGVAGTRYGGSAVAGRRIVRLAAITAGLCVFLYATIGVAVLGAGGPPDDSGWTVAAIVNDRLGNNAVFYLWFFPLWTAALGWAAATAARARPRPATTAGPSSFAGSPSLAGPPPFATAGQPGEEALSPVTSPQQPHPAARARDWRRTARRLLLACAIVAAVVLLAAVYLLRS